MPLHSIHSLIRQNRKKIFGPLKNPHTSAHLQSDLYLPLLSSLKDNLSIYLTPTSTLRLHHLESNPSSFTPEQSINNYAERHCTYSTQYLPRITLSLSSDLLYKLTMNPLLSILFRAFFAIFLLCQAGGSCYFALFLKLYLDPFFTERSMGAELKTSYFGFIYLCVSALFASLGFVVILQSYRFKGSTRSKPYKKQQKKKRLPTSIWVLSTTFGVAIAIFMVGIACATAQYAWTWAGRFERDDEQYLANNCRGLAGMTIAILSMAACYLICEIYVRGEFAYALCFGSTERRGGSEENATMPTQLIRLRAW